MGMITHPLAGLGTRGQAGDLAVTDAVAQPKGQLAASVKGRRIAAVARICATAAVAIEAPAQTSGPRLVVVALHAIGAPVALALPGGAPQRRQAWWPGSAPARCARAAVAARRRTTPSSERYRPAEERASSRRYGRPSNTLCGGRDAKKYCSLLS